MDAEDLLYLLYTSGTTGKPKGIAHTTGGYLTQVAATHRIIFDIHDDDVFWCAADCGWVTGHSYIVYGPLANHTTGIMYEGAPDWPDKDRWWSIVETYKATILYTAPTAIRAFMRWGTEYPDKHDLSSLRLLGSVGEPINPEAWVWYWKVIGGGRAPSSTPGGKPRPARSSSPRSRGSPSSSPARPPSPSPVSEADIFDDEGHSVPLGGGGYLVLTRPWPAISGPSGETGSIRRDLLLPVRTRDLRRRRRREARRGRVLLAPGTDRRRDERRRSPLSTFEIESALVDNDKVAESAVVSKPDDLVGEAIVAFVTLKSGVRGRRRDGRGAPGSRGREDRKDRPTARDHLHDRPAEDPVGQDHAAAPPRRGTWTAARRRHDARRTPRSSSRSGTCRTARRPRTTRALARAVSSRGGVEEVDRHPRRGRSVSSTSSAWCPPAVEVHLHLVCTRTERVRVDHHLTERTAAVVLAGDQQHRGLHPIHVGHRVPLSVELGKVHRRASQGREVPCAQRGSALVVRRHVVPDRDPRARRTPPVRMQTGDQRREVSAP